MIPRFPGSVSLARRALRLPRRTRAAKPGRTCAICAKRPPAPPFWQNIAPAIRARSGTSGPDRHRHWLLVLQAKRIRHRFFDRDRAALYVPPVAAKTALHEILAFETERPAPAFAQPPFRRGLYWYAALLAALIPWHRLRWDHLFANSPLPESARDWLVHGGLDAYRVAASNEWWRAVTSLTLHADAAHLASNFIMGVLFGIPLCRHTGVGFGFFLTILAGAAGNIATAYLRPASFLSQGFSTAVFASVGLLAAFAAAFAAKVATEATDGNRRTAVKQGFLKSLVPLGAGLGILAMLGGSEAPNVDYLAHTMGLAAGIVLGLAVAFLAPGLLYVRGTKNALLQGASLALALGLIVLCWRSALGA